MSDMAIYWLPLVIILAVWIYFIRVMKKNGSPFASLERSVAEVQKQNAEITKLLAEIKSTIENRKS